LSLYPPPFEPDNLQNEKVVFVNVTNALHTLEFDLGAQKLSVTSRISFRPSMRGLPVIDLAPSFAPKEVQLGTATNVPYVEVRAPRPARRTDRLGSAAHFRVIKQTVDRLAPNDPDLEAVIRYEVPANVTNWLRMKNGEVRCFFDMSDYSAVGNRNFLERYLPANAEFDRHPVIIEVTLKGTTSDHRLFTNGELFGGEGTWRVEYPDWYSASCPFFLLTATSQIEKPKQFIVGQPSGEWLPVTIVGNKGSAPDDYEEGVRKGLDALQKDFGEFPHRDLVLFVDQPGMEYAGAATVSRYNLLHELTHSYFGRGVLPINGDAGWIDEAIATWYEARYRMTGTAVAFEPRRRRWMGAVSPYRRHTYPKDGRAGMMLLRYVDYMLKGRLIEFLAGFHMWHTREGIDSHTFQADLESFSGQDFSSLFNRCVYGQL
jgi:hypothetical protein